MAFNLCLLPEAERDYAEALEWYGGPQTDTGSRFATDVANAFSKLESHPTFYRYFFGSHRRILEIFSYQIVYKIEETRVLIYAIYHTSRNDTELRKRLS